MVYIREAHASDGWAIEESGWSILPDADDATDRSKAAGQACSMLKLPFPVVVDTMDDTVAWRWSGWPERLFVIDAEGRVVYVGAQGPWGFWPLEASAPYAQGGEHGLEHGEPLDRFLESHLT